MATTKPTPAHAAPLDLVIFGGLGDLSVRKLLPALYMAHMHDNLPEQTRIHALGRALAATALDITRALGGKAPRQNTHQP